MKRTFGALLVAGCMTSSMAVLIETPALARDGWNAAGVALGAAGGLALGSVLANPGPRYLAAPAYRAPPRYIETVEEEPVCHIRRSRTIDEYGDETIRRIRVCE